jgi:hypothetical protein
MKGTYHKNGDAPNALKGGILRAEWLRTRKSITPTKISALQVRLYEYSLRSRMFYASKAYPMQQNAYRRSGCTSASSKTMSARCSANAGECGWRLSSYITLEFARHSMMEVNIAFILHYTTVVGKVQRWWSCGGRLAAQRTRHGCAARLARSGRATCHTSIARPVVLWACTAADAADWCAM